MNPASWCVALLDSGMDATDVAVHAHCQVDAQGQVQEGSSVADSLGHGTRIARVLTSGGATPRLLVAQVLDERGRASAVGVAAAIRWAVQRGAGLIHMSLGLSQDREVLAGAVSEARDAGAILLASTPARGERSFPARYDGVIAATGDARCAPDEISCLPGEPADFGGCARSGAAGPASSGGASIGAAHVSRFILDHLPPGASEREVRLALSREATYRGREHRA
ncbi:MAG: S8 family serine peptidase [Steroidobacteraceae bacterium]